MTEPTPARQVRADHDATTLTVYQAYGHEIADAAVAAGRFVEPFKLTRMTWIKPSFLWMMYRCGWATKPGQERVLALKITHKGFEEALARASLTHFDPEVYASREEWEAHKEASPVRVQWDPERSLRLESLGHRSIQIGLGPAVVPAYVNDWTVSLRDITPTVREIAGLLRAGQLAAARALLPVETPVRLGEIAARTVGAER